VIAPSHAPFVERVSALKLDELDRSERYVAASRFSMPPPPRRRDQGDQGLGFSDLRRLMRIGVLTRPEPQAIPGFPAAWEMVVALTPLRLVSWQVTKGTDLPGTLLGSVHLRDVAEIDLVTLPQRRGRSLAVKFVLHRGPRVLLDVVAGFRADAEQLTSEAQSLLA
jgi:hypothetical protein